MLIIKNFNLYHNSRPQKKLLENVNVSLDSNSQKKVALIGPNGSGKSTLLKQIVSGHKDIYISNENILYLDQHQNSSNTQSVFEIFNQHIDQHTESYKIDIMLDELDFNPEILEKKFSNLSGGQMLKVRIGELLLQDPTILILDEPTNHLDQASKDFLSSFINSFQGSVLLVSHDRNFLEKTINQVWSIQHDKRLQVYTGKFSEWRSEQSALIDKEVYSYQRLESQISQLHKWLQMNQNHPKYRFSSIVHTKKQKLIKLEQQLATKVKVKIPKVIFSHSSPSNKYKSNLILSYNFQNHPVLKNLTGKIYNNDKILLEGANGSGKTTLLTALQNSSEYVTHNKKIQIAMITQLQTYDTSQTVSQIIHKHTQLDTTKIYQKLDQLNLKHLINSKLKTLSGGEQKRLQIAILLSSQADLYLLDEPTNHLDIYTQELFQEFLMSLTKTFILVSHDKFLKDDIVFSRQINLTANV